MSIVVVVVVVVGGVVGGGGGGGGGGVVVVVVVVVGIVVICAVRCYANEPLSVKEGLSLSFRTETQNRRCPRGTERQRELDGPATLLPAQISFSY